MHAAVSPGVLVYAQTGKAKGVMLYDIRAGRSWRSAELYTMGGGLT